VFFRWTEEGNARLAAQSRGLLAAQQKRHRRSARRVSFQRLANGAAQSGGAMQLEQFQ